jgi:tRNA threonylcarbamoyladenosine biosynthesis protein TsaB
MNLLALETATESCSVALLAGERLFVRSEIAPRRHAELLLPMCEEVLGEAGLARRDLDALAVGCGPGAFTGVRLAISAAQGIALALDIPVAPVSSLAALALQAPDNGAAILAVIDARMGEIYAGAFRRTGDGLVEAIGPESAAAGPAIAMHCLRAFPRRPCGPMAIAIRKLWTRLALRFRCCERAAALRPNSSFRCTCATRWR